MGYSEYEAHFQVRNQNIVGQLSLLGFLTSIPCLNHRFSLDQDNLGINAGIPLIPHNVDLRSDHFK